MEIIFEMLVFSETWERFDYDQATEAVWDIGQLTSRVRGDLDRYGIGDECGCGGGGDGLGLMFFTSVGWSNGKDRCSFDLEREAVKKIVGEYFRLGIEPKVGSRAFVNRKSYGSLWD